jgi:hypothetical protein
VVDYLDSPVAAAAQADSHGNFRGYRRSRSDLSVPFAVGGACGQPALEVALEVKRLPPFKLDNILMAIDWYKQQGRAVPPDLLEAKKQLEDSKIGVKNAAS